MLRQMKSLFCFALMVLAVSASAFIDSGFQALEQTDEVFPMFRNLRPSGAPEQFVYDASGNRIGFYNAEGKPITFGFDAQGRITAITNAINKVTSFTYDLNGNRTNITYPGGLTVGYTYDEENRLESVIANYTNETRMFSFGYDGANRLTGISYPNGIAAMIGYDAESHVTNYVHGTVMNPRAVHTLLTLFQPNLSSAYRAKITYITLNTPTACPPRTAVSVNRSFWAGTGAGSRSDTNSIRYATFLTMSRKIVS